MKSYLKTLLPEGMVRILRKSRYNKFTYYISASGMYLSDMRRFMNSAFLYNKNKNKENIEARIIIRYHAIEKGLTNNNFREGFGKFALQQLMEALNDYVVFGYDSNNLIFQSGISALNEYVERHKDSSIDTSKIKSFLEKVVPGAIDNLSGTELFNKDELLMLRNERFDAFIKSRSSVRDFADQELDKILIEQALEIAANTPSVCNRMPWKVHIIYDQELLSEVLQIQNGLKGFGENIGALFLITANNNYLSDVTERNQGYIDSGMYSMNLLLALHYVGLASCPLNADFSMNDDKKIRHLMGIAANESLVMFIAVGNYKNEIYTTKSPKKPLESYVLYH